MIKYPENTTVTAQTLLEAVRVIDAFAELVIDGAADGDRYTQMISNLRSDVADIVNGRLEHSGIHEAATTNRAAFLGELASYCTDLRNELAEVLAAQSGIEA